MAAISFSRYCHKFTVCFYGEQLTCANTLRVILCKCAGIQTRNLLELDLSEKGCVFLKPAVLIWHATARFLPERNLHYSHSSIIREHASVGPFLL
jgi:hypothetical protein